MLFVSMLKTVMSSDGSFKGMKFWWEWIVDSFLILLVMCSSVLYLNYLFEGNQLWCLPSYGPTNESETFEMLFVGSICKLQMDISLIIYFPYFSVATVLLLVAAHFFWKEIPWIQSKINLFGELCVEVMQLDQVFYERDKLNLALLRNFHFSEKQYSSVKCIQMKMLYLLLEKSSLAKYHFYKTAFTCLICFISMCVILVVMLKVHFFKSVFYCHITSPYYTKFNGKFTCDISSALPTYAIMIFHAILLIIILLITLKALWNHYRHPFPMKRMNCIALFDEYKSYPGFLDILFLFALIRSNVYDGGLLLNNFMKVMLLKNDSIITTTHDKNIKNSSDYMLDNNSDDIDLSLDINTIFTVTSDNIDIGDDTSIHFISANDLKNLYLLVLKKFNMTEYNEKITIVNHSFSCGYSSKYSLVHCLWQFHNELEPLAICYDYSLLIKQILDEIIAKKEYFLLYINYLRIKKYNLKPLSGKKWFKMFKSFDKIVNICYYVVLSSFCNLYHTTIHLISLEENENNFLEIFTSYDWNNKYGSPNCIKHFYLVKAQKIYFALKQNMNESKNSLYSTIFDTVYEDKTDKEKKIVKKLFRKYKKQKQLLNVVNNDLKKESVFRNRRLKGESIFVSFDWKSTTHA